MPAIAIAQRSRAPPPALSLIDGARSDPSLRATSRHLTHLDRAAAEEWIRAHVHPVGPIQTTHIRPWSTVLRVPLADSSVWFKACAPVQAFEPRLTAELFAR